MADHPPAPTILTAEQVNLTRIALRTALMIEANETMPLLAERADALAESHEALRSQAAEWEATADVLSDDNAMADLYTAEKERVAELEAALDDAVVVIEKMANGASRKDVSPWFERVHAAALARGVPTPDKETTT